MTEVNTSEDFNIHQDQCENRKSCRKSSFVTDFSSQM